MMNLYSQRNKSKEWSYYPIPTEFKVQLCFILSDVFSLYYRGPLPRCIKMSKPWKFIFDKYCRETGVIVNTQGLKDYKSKVDAILLNDQISLEHFFDAVELAGMVLFSQKNSCCKTFYRGKLVPWKTIAEDAIAEINARFRQHNLGYELVNGQIIRKDSELLVQETITPAFSLLQDKRFKSAEDEMQKAFRFRRDGENAEAILNAAKAFESTMAIICNELQYTIKGTKRSAGVYLTALRDNGFYPSYLNDHLTHICNTLDKGLPCVRNEHGGHGAGTASTYISDAFADYALHLAATNIVFLVDLFNEKEIQA